MIICILIIFEERLISTPRLPTRINDEEEECTLGHFMELYDLINLVKESTCFKSVQNPLCVDLFLTNNYQSFQNPIAVSTGISDCHKMIVTVLKRTFEKAKPKGYHLLEL